MLHREAFGSCFKGPWLDLKVVPYLCFVRSFPGSALNTATGGDQWEASDVILNATVVVSLLHFIVVLTLFEVKEALKTKFYHHKTVFTLH